MTEHQRPSTAHSTAWRWFAFGWGFAEAVAFFIVPDVLLSRLVLQNTRLGFEVCLAALAGAVIGGFGLFVLAGNRANAESLLAFFAYLPGITPSLEEKARIGLQNDGLVALLRGATTGIPYKLYAVTAAQQSFPIGRFLAVSALTRAFRFFTVTTVAWFANRTAFCKLSLNTKLQLHSVLWLLFYAVYFWVMKT